MTTVPGWLGAGLLTAGVSAAVLAGAGAAQADSEGDPEAGAVSTSVSTEESEPSASTTHRREATDEADADEPDSRRIGPRRSDDPVRIGSKSTTPDDDESATTDPTAGHLDDEGVEGLDPETSRVVKPVRRTDTFEAASIDLSARAEAVAGPPQADDRRELAQPLRVPSADELPTVHTDLAAVPAPGSSASLGGGDGTTPAASAGPIRGVGDILGPFQPDYPPLIAAVGSAVFNLIGALVQIVDGPPAVPWELRDSIRVSSSTLVLAPGTEVPADWYFPTNGQPERLIYLQHGILASGPMYSHTAAYLAERTNSVVVATTLTSNPFANEGIWLGGDNMHKAVAELFLDDSRAALNASLTTATLQVGTPNITVPTEFVLVGHSLGGGFAPGVGGHYAAGLVARRAGRQEAPNHLAGITLLDGVPFSPIVPNAMDRLKQLEESNGGDPADYVPVYEIGAPLNFLNANSKVNEELSAARPGRFNGVVVNGGVHMDGMLGANPLIQASAYLVAGIPQSQNPPAVQLLMAGWINDMFEGDIDPTTGRCLGEGCEGQYGSPGETIVIATDTGEASVVVIDSGTLPEVKRLSAHYFEPPHGSSVIWPPTRPASIPLRIGA